MKRLKRYKPLLLQIGILLLLISIALFFLEQRTRFISYDLTKHYVNNKTIEIAGFEEGEQWQGNYSYDSERILEGKTSITLSSWAGKENSIFFMKDTAIPAGYRNGYLSVYVPDEKRLQAVSSFELHLNGEKTEEKIYSLGSELRAGWNRLAIAIPAWKKITNSSLYIVSKPQTIAEVNFDRFWIENTTSYKSDVFSTESPHVSLRTIGQRTYLYYASSALEPLTLNSPSKLQKGTLTIALIPEHAKEIQLTLNGTTLKLAGKSMDECELSNESGESKTEKLSSVSGRDDLYVFLKVEIQGRKIVYSVSNNGVDFTSCGAVTFTQTKQVQLSLRGSYLIDSYSAEY